MSSPSRMPSTPITPPAPISPATAPPTRRRPSLTDSILNARPPLGALAATGEAFGSAPSLAELRRNSGSSASVPRRGGPGGRRSASVGGLSGSVVHHSSIPETATGGGGGGGGGGVDVAGQHGGDGAEKAGDEEKPAAGAIVGGWLRAFWKYFTRPLGFCVTIYMLNVVAWGGMLFLLLCNAAPAMCRPTCDDINSPRRVWIEIDSQILNALFCVTGFGLVPWRFRDLFYLLQWRCCGQSHAYLRLQEIHRNWYRPADATPAATTPPTGSWKLDYVIWMYAWNTFFQCCLSGFMWGMDRRRRPAWSTGLFVALACLVAGLAAGQVWWEARKVQAIEHDETGGA